MAQKVEVTLVDDLDGSEAGQTVLFALDGKSYEIDLSDDNAATFREALAPFVGAARKATAARSPIVRRFGSVKPARDLKAVRTWARDNGWPDLSDRGRCPAEVLEAFDAAQAA